MQRPKKSLTRPALAAYLCICAAVLLLLGVWVSSALREARVAREMLLQAELSRIRTLVDRAVGRIDQEMERGGLTDLSQLATGPWPNDPWAEMATVDQEHFYAVVVDSAGRILRHSNAQLVGKRLGRTWFERVIPEVGDDIVQTRSPLLAGGRPAFGLRIPIVANHDEIGDYHAGFTTAWFDQFVSDQRPGASPLRLLAIGGLAIIVLLAMASLYYLASSALGLHEAMSQRELQQASETSQLAAGLAHEIRNPMHALRLNLHALAKVDGDNRLRLSREEHDRLLTESNREIDRVERLMQELLNFANPEAPRNELVDVAAEIQSTLEFVHREMIRQQITVETDFPESPTLVCMDSDRFRQLLLNLLRNAEQALDGPGRIDVSVTPTDRYALVTVANNGPAIPAQDHERIFEPFYSTKKNGSGLGLPLVRRYVKEANGTIACEDNRPQGTAFRIKLPRFTQTAKRNHSS